MPKKVIIIGAGPAGLTAAFELLKDKDFDPLILEKSERIGGISTTLDYKGNKIDIGGHRFFSKSDRVMDWWANIMPMQKAQDNTQISYQNKTRDISEGKADPEKTDVVMLIRKRKSRIYFLRKFFDYPIKMSKDTFVKLGISRMFFIGMSYIRARIFPIRKERNLEDFFVNRFGDKLYKTFFKSYTEKVWGVSCQKISAEWGAQRIKGLSLTAAVKDFYKKKFKKSSDIKQKDVETSLVEQFLYPKYGPGQMWDEVKKRVEKAGGKVVKNLQVKKLNIKGNKIVSVDAYDTKSKKMKTFKGDYFISTMPVQELIAGIKDVPTNVKEVSEGLIYRDFITVGLLLNKLKITEKGKKLVEDTWLYIQEPDVKIGRLQIFNNWSPYMVKEKDKVWIGLEYFCFKGDDLWNKPEKEMATFAIDELAKIGIIDKVDVLDSFVFKMEKTYPAYFGHYTRFNEIREYLDKFENLFLVGRNGMHKYNNQDHSMLTAMTAVENIKKGIKTKDNLWTINTEQEYHENKAKK